ncbi:MAG: hypothetical protein E7519_01055 [Ruminococcaceae bacterium]|nr:hypothetical protein [Oscillospiraceae bacterium]
MRKLLTILVFILLLFSVAGCNREKLESLGRCPVAMQTVTVKDSDKDHSYSFLAPADWMAVSLSAYLVRAYSAKAITENQDNYPYINITNYEKVNSLTPREERMRIYKDLFNNKDDDYIGLVEKELALVNAKPSDIKFKLYKGEHGKIAAIQYTYTDTAKGITFLVVDCYREDITYSVYGSADIRSKDFDPSKTIPWIIDSLIVK